MNLPISPSWLDIGMHACPFVHVKLLSRYRSQLWTDPHGGGIKVRIEAYYWGALDPKIFMVWNTPKTEKFLDFVFALEVPIKDQ